MKRNIIDEYKALKRNFFKEDYKDELFDQAVVIISQYDRVSASLLQRTLSIGYARAARLIDQLETTGVVGPGDGATPRDVLIKSPDDIKKIQQQVNKEIEIPPS